MTPINPSSREKILSFLQEFQLTYQENQQFQRALKERLVEEIDYKHLPFFAQPKTKNLIETMILFLESYYQSMLVSRLRLEKLVELLKILKELKMVGSTESEKELKTLFTDCQGLETITDKIIPVNYDQFLWFIWKWEPLLINQIRQLKAGNRAEQLTMELITIRMNSDLVEDKNLPEGMSTVDYSDYNEAMYQRSELTLQGSPFMRTNGDLRGKNVANPPTGYHEKVAELMELRCFDFYLSMGMLLEMTETLDNDLHNMVYSYLKNYSVI